MFIIHRHASDCLHAWSLSAHLVSIEALVRQAAICVYPSDFETSFSVYSNTGTSTLATFIEQLGLTFVVWTTALMFVSKRGYADIVQVLVVAGANISAKDKVRALFFNYL